MEALNRDMSLALDQSDFDDDRKYSEDAVKFNAGIRSPKKRMQRIMRNIIRNEGKFVP